MHFNSADSILICSSALYNSIKVVLCYACTYLCVCMCMYACKVCIRTEINLMSINLSDCVVRDTEKMSFQEFLKRRSEGAFRMLGGRRFHSTGAAKVNARSPRVLEDLIVGCSRRMELDDRRVRLDDLTCMS